MRKEIENLEDVEWIDIFVQKIKNLAIRIAYFNAKWKFKKEVAFILNNRDMKDASYIMNIMWWVKTQVETHLTDLPSKLHIIRVLDLWVNPNDVEMALLDMIWVYTNVLNKNDEEFSKNVPNRVKAVLDKFNYVGIELTQFDFHTMADFLFDLDHSLSKLGL
jgi:hypothetical protein